MVERRSTWEEPPLTSSAELPMLTNEVLSSTTRSPPSIVTAELRTPSNWMPETLMFAAELALRRGCCSSSESSGRSESLAPSGGKMYTLASCRSM
jgi:hypothetical protein